MASKTETNSNLYVEAFGLSPDEFLWLDEAIKFVGGEEELNYMIENFGLKEVKQKGQDLPPLYSVRAMKSAMKAWESENRKK